MRGVRSAPLSSDLHQGRGRGGSRVVREMGEGGWGGALVSPSEGLRRKLFLFIGRPRADGRATISGERRRRSELHRDGVSLLVLLIQTGLWWHR